MKMDRLNPQAVRNASRIDRVTEIGEQELANATGGIEPFSCVWVEGETMKYHNGYPRAV